MDRGIAEGRLTFGAAGRRELHFEQATTESDPALRRILKENPIPGWIHLSYERDPDFFLASAVEGDLHQTVVAKETRSEKIVGFCSRSERDAFLNGTIGRLGYLSQLRVDARFHATRRVLAGGFRKCHALHREGSVPFYLASIIEKNLPARRMLTSKLPDFPAFHPYEPFCTLVLPVRAPRRIDLPPGFSLERGSARGLGEIVTCLQRNNRRYQLAPVWTGEDLLSSRCRGLTPECFNLVRYEGKVVGCAAVWDQSGFKQTVVRGYEPGPALWRPIFNAVAPWVGLPALPMPGRPLRLVYLSHIAIDSDHPEALRWLVERSMKELAGRPDLYLTFGFAARNPLLREVKRWSRPLEYRSLLYLVSWEDGEEAIASLDDRIPHIEVATL